MNRIPPLIASAIIACLALGTAPAAFAQSTTGTIRTTIIPRLALSKTADIDFGQIMASSSLAGSVTITPAGSRSAGGGATLAGGTPSAGEFIGLGNDNQIVVFSFGAPSAVLTRVSGTETMTVDSFTLGATTADGLNDLGSSGRWRIIANNGQFRMPVGATLRIGAAQAPGQYEGNFTLTAVYQ
jgi:hypothetical protein